MLKKFINAIFLTDNKLRLECNKSANLTLFNSLYDNQNNFFVVDIENCVDRLSGKFNGDISIDGSSPIYGLAKILISSQSQSEARCYLEDFYERITEANIKTKRRVVSIKGNGDSYLSAFMLPWEGRKPISHKTRLYGPVNKGYVNFEIDRLSNLLYSIEKRGYSENLSDDPIRGYVLINEKQHRFVIKGGQHRVAILSALGFNKINVKWQPNWPRMILRNHYTWWPQVSDGSIADCDALDEFDRFFY